MKHFIHFLKERYGYVVYSFPEVKSTSLLGLIAVFLFSLIRPFGIGQLLILEIGLYAITVSIIIHFALKGIILSFNLNTDWRVIHEILKSLIHLLILASALFLYIHNKGLIKANLKVYSKFLIYTISCGFVPLAVKALMVQNRRLLENIRKTKNFDSSLKLKEIEISLISPVKSDKFKGLLKNVLYIVSDENYVWIIEKNNKTQIRLSLKSALEQLKEYPFIKTHRSYLVNSIHIKSVKSRHLVLNTNKKLPISRKFRKEYLEKNIQ